MSEWAGFRAMLNSSDGWSSRGGQTKNPYILDRSPAGSSAGSAVAVAANLCCVAVGTETSGSIIAPSSCSGIVGLKPTVGLISRSGIIPISASLDTPGPMGRTVTDVAILLSVLVGADIADEATQNLVKGEAIAYDKFLDRASLKGKRIGFEKPSFLAPEIETLYKKAIDDFRALGAEMVEVDLRNQLMMGVMTTLPLLFTEFKDGINKYLSKSKGKVKSLEELIAFNKANEAKVMPYFKQDLLEASQKAPAIGEDAYQKVLKSTKEFKNKVAQTIKALDVDAVISSSATGLTPCIDHSKGSTGGAGFLFAGLAAAAGLPHITLPMGSYKELPQGLSIISGFFEEAKLLSIAFAYEQATKHRAAPKFIESNKDLPCN